MQTLVTGATGFIGSAVVRQLIKAGYRVRVLVRSNSNCANLTGLPVEISIGDLTDPASLKYALINCSALFHVAADYRLWTPNPERMNAINVQGTRNLMLAAIAAGVKRIVYTSSVAVLKISGTNRSEVYPVNESADAELHDMIGHYKRSKWMAETHVKQLIAEQKLPAIIVNPSTPIGPRDIKPTPTGRIIVDAANGRMPAYVDTGLNWVHVDDVAYGHLLAYAKGRIGERYILGGRNITLKEILYETAALTGQSPPLFKLPHKMVLPLAYLSEAWAKAIHSKNEPRVTLDGVRMAQKKMFFSSSKARKELGYRHRPIKTALREALDWFIQNGSINKRFQCSGVRSLPLKPEH